MQGRRVSLASSCFQAEAQLVEDGGAFAEDRVDLDQLLVGGNQVANVLPWYFKVVQRLQVS
jgi:hypothetical protein